MTSATGSDGLASGPFKSGGAGGSGAGASSCPLDSKQGQESRFSQQEEAQALLLTDSRAPVEMPEAVTESCSSIPAQNAVIVFKPIEGKSSERP